MRQSTTTSLLLLLLALPLAPACSKETPPAPPAAGGAQGKAALPDRDPALARRLVGEGAVLLDVRTTEEYGERHLDGAVNIPVGDLGGRLAEVEKLTGGDKNKPIVVYCQTGGRSARAKTALVEAGYTQVTNVGGIDDWDRK
ncbi:rhodanese-like domain-containing protein [Polyangium aurulentum]|uniref:rhodanese-like domain-containing protein n=1 Tax=Polyangium aurulentum TaxID=2567896 RepID=UPI0010AE76D0|nr:rhodanese-like domain-containing protein [Polyangium aurulentum]UQA55512.1 rhodanese-like domain-containing protein [Polyangium aurulentum]